MANDRGRRGGRAGAKSGKASGRGRASNQVNPNAPDRGENGGEGGRGGGTGGAQGGRGQPRRGGRGGKRVAGSDAAAGTSPAAKARKVAHPNKKAKPGEAKVLWSPGKAGGGEGGAGSSIYKSAGPGGAGAAGAGAGGNSNVAQKKLSSLAASFRERYGEHVGFDDEEWEGSSRGGTGATQQTARRKRSLSGGGGAVSAEETARSMSPSKLAAEMQKARARAREERFGAGSSANRPSSLVRRKPAIGKLSVQEALPSAQAPVENVTGRTTDDENRRSVNRISPTPSPPSEASTLSPKASPSEGVSAVTTVSASASGAVAGATCVPETNDFHRKSLASPATGASGELPSVPPTPATSSSVATGALPIVTPLDIGEDGPSAPGASGGFVTVVDEVTPVETTCEMSPSKRPALDSGDVVVIEPPAKTAETSSPAATRGDAAKVHTLRLRLRTDLPGGEQTRFGGVEESKSFEPPNSPVDGGVEECKGFDPPNLPPTPQKQQQQQQKRRPTPSPSSAVSPPAVGLSNQGKPPQPPVASAASSPVVATRPSPPPPSPSPAPPSPAAATSPSISRAKSADKVTPTAFLSRESSWGPSFGIAATAETAAPAAAASSAALPQPVAHSGKNPWVLSPDAPTFAKNQGRPLARSFSQPTSDTNAVNSGAGDDDNRGLGRDRETARGAGVERPAVRSSGGGGGREEGGASGHYRRPTSRPADTSRVARQPPAAAAAAPSAVADAPSAAAVATAATAATVTTATSAATASAATAAAAPVCIRAENEPGVQRVSLTAISSAESSIRSSGGQGGASRREATRTEGQQGAVAVAEGAAPDARPEESVMGMRVGGRAGELLERLRREREESLDFERKLTQALLDL